MDLFKDMNAVFGFILTAAVAASAIAYVISQWRGGSMKANTEAVTAYKNELEAVKLSLTRKDTDIARLTGEIAKLQAELNQMKGRNETLENTLALRSPNFESTFMEIAKSIKDLRDDLRSHYEDDKKNFKAIKDVDDRKMKVLESILKNQVDVIMPSVNKK